MLRGCGEGIEVPADQRHGVAEGRGMICEGIARFGRVIAERLDAAHPRRSQSLVASAAM